MQEPTRFAWSILDNAGKIDEVVLNQKCAAGIGIFLRSIARRLGLSLEEMSRMTGKAGSGRWSTIAAPCLPNWTRWHCSRMRFPSRRIAQAIHEAMAARINSILNDKVVPPKEIHRAGWRPGQK